MISKITSTPVVSFAFANSNFSKQKVNNNNSYFNKDLNTDVVSFSGKSTQRIIKDVVENAAEAAHPRVVNLWVAEDLGRLHEEHLVVHELVGDLRRRSAQKNEGLSRESVL